jgi:DNA-binding beta-propeller fold protein YncE
MDTLLDTTHDGERLVLAGQNVLVVDARNGKTVAEHAPRGPGIRDVDVLHDGRVLITEETEWRDNRPVTRLSVRDATTGEQTCEVDTDNCADEVVLSRDEGRALLAPTLCAQDPVTVVALTAGACSVEKQLPGFGPVALSPNGKVAVAFLDRDAVDASGQANPAQVKGSSVRYHLMFIDMTTLSFETRPQGDWLPRFVFSPTGDELLVDTPMDVMGGVEVHHVADGAVSTVGGLPVRLNHFAFSPDGSRAFVLDRGLHELDVANAKMTHIMLPFTPSSVDVTPDGLTLLVVNLGRNTVHFVDAITKRDTRQASF